MVEWVFDDSNKNILYKNNGSEDTQILNYIK